MYQDRYWHARTFQAVTRLKEIANDAGRSMISLAFGWLLHHTASDVVILGASSIEQLKQNLDACGQGPLLREVVSACDEVWQEFRGPLPSYNR